MEGQHFSISCIEELFENPASVSDEHIQEISLPLYQSKDLSRHLESFSKLMSSFSKDSTFFLDTSMHTDDINEVGSSRQMNLFFECSDDEFESALEEIKREINMDDIVMELGYGCTVNSSHCRDVLSLFQPLTEVMLSKLLAAIARTHTGLEDTQIIHSTFCLALTSGSICDSSLLNSWNVDVLVDSIKQLAPKTNWTRVMESLDHEGFAIPDKASFSFLMSIYAKACQDPFPLHAICGSVWKNIEGQISFLRHAIASPPDVFSFSHCSRRLSYPDSLHLSNGQGNQAWFCLELLEVLCQLAERGHIGSVRAILQYPIVHFPEVLLIGIAQINTSYNLLQYEVLCDVFPSILKDSPNNIVIHFLWHLNPNLVLRGFVDAHKVPSSLSRILDVCQELKILSSVLDTTPFSFSIRLAAIASRKEHINLEKWINENLNTDKDAFFEECLKFLKEMNSNMASDIPDNPLQQSRTGALNAYQETYTVIFKALLGYSGKLTSPQLLEKFESLDGPFVSKVQNDGATDLTNVEGSPHDIEAETNAYFHQLFSGQLTVEAMIQMLARFKESSDRREQQIFESVIGNLFEEYKFFPKYPDQQLKLTAVLVGSLIKHQLVNHLALGIALRFVLDALRKSVDSRMFAFGTKALEQFMDRLIEWPQYCNHILQISHLRGTHAELVSVIEQTLARISSSQSESNISNTLPADQLQSPPVPSVENKDEPSEVPWTGSSSSQAGHQHSSFQLQQRQQGFLGDNKPNVSSPNYTMPLLSQARQPSVVSSPSDSVTVHKSLQAPQPQHSASVLSGILSSPGFTRPRGSGSAGMPRQPSYNTGFGSALNIETLVAAAEQRDITIEAPTSDIQDKIFFMINNISNVNVEAKAKEFTEVIKEQYYPWFAQYMVMKRASIEPNFHDLYLKFLDKANSKALNKEIVKATYENCKVLLRSELIKSSSEERSLLKNLGSWLGKFTIGRNQALLAKEIDPKALIQEAYEKGLMIAVIPFTSKVLEPCQSSLAYRPPNPWTMGILGLLVEIYNLPNLKMNLKFDIEVLFKNLAVDMKTVVPTSLLKDRVREIEGNPDFSNKDIIASQPPVITEVSPGIMPAISQLEIQPAVNTSHPTSIPNVPAQYTGPFHLPSNVMVEDEKPGPLVVPERGPSSQGLTPVASSPSPFALNQLLTIIPKSDSYININPKLVSMGSQLQFHRIIQMAMDKAIREIVSPIIQRSVTIAIRTTKELVLKDYALEMDDSVISRAAHLMVGTLAGSLAHVTCKEPLRVALSNQLRSVLQNLNVASERAEQIIQIILTDHLDLGCAVIENVASDKAMELIDGDIGPSFTSMRKQRELSGSPYYDAGTYVQGTFVHVPEALRPKPGRLSVAQQRVYDDFIRNIWQSQPSQNTNVASAGPPGMSGSVNSSIPRAYGSTSSDANSSMLSTSQAVPGFSATAQQFDLSAEDPERSSTQFLSVSSTNVGVNDGVIQPNTEISPGSVTAPIPSAVNTAELHSVESSAVTKESGAAAQLSPTTSGTERPSVSETSLTTGDALDKYQQVAKKLESLIAKDARDADFQVVVSEVTDIILKSVSREEVSLAVAQKVFKSLYDGASGSSHIASHIAILDAIRDVCKLVVKELTSWLVYLDEERKFNKEITVALIRSDLINIVEYNVHLSKLMDGGRNKVATEFAIHLVQTLLFNETGFSMSEMCNVMEVLTKLAMKPGAPESLQQLVEMARTLTANATGFTDSKEEKARQARDKKILSGRSSIREEYNINESSIADHSGLQEKVVHFFEEWCRICDFPATDDTMYSHYILQLQQNGWIKGDDVTERVFRTLMMISVARSVVTEQAINPGALLLQTTLPLPHLSYFSIDAYSKLVVLVLKYCSVDQGSSKSFLLNKILSLTVRVIQKDAEDKKISFSPRPYFRLFVNWLLDLTSPDPALDGANFQVLTSFANAFHSLQPLKVPGWSFAWLELVSHRSFMPKLLTISPQKSWPYFQRLLVDLFKFMEPYLRNADMSEPITFLYKGTLRVLLVLLHDFPEFLCEYHFSFCDVIPPSCIQMRNVILSAFPRNMRLPDPSTPNLKIDLLAEISQPPRILSDYDSALKVKQMKHDVDEYLKTRPEGSSFLTELKQRLLLHQSEASLTGIRYNVPLINSLVLYVGTQAIEQLQSKSTQHAPTQQMSHTPPMDIFLVGAAMDIFQSLIKNLDTEGRYLFLNAVANQLRYPNNHTHYFSFVLLYLFAEASQDIIQEQITRVLLERLIVNRPHPWGLLITFIELIKNPRYNFWNRPFTRCAPEIEKLFESVARSCGGPKTVDDGMVTGGLADGNH